MSENDKKQPQLFHCPGDEAASFLQDIADDYVFDDTLPAFPTINGKSLSYDYAKAKSGKGQGLKTYNTKNFRKALRVKIDKNATEEKQNDQKARRPRIDLFKSTQKGIWLDFDNLDKLRQTFHTITTWDKAEEAIRNEFGSYGYVGRSSRGKVKVFVPLDLDFIDQEIAKEIALKITGKLFYPVIDTGGLRYNFIGADDYCMLSDYLMSDKVINDIEHNKELTQKTIKKERGKDIVYTLSGTKQSTYEWLPYSGKISENMIDDVKDKTKNKFCEGIIRCMLGYKTCMDKTRGVDLPVKVMAKALNTNIRQISQAIGELKGLCILKVNNYQVGVRGNSYAFTGYWLNEAKRIIKEMVANPSKAPTSPCGGLQAILDDFRPDHWNLNLFKLTNYFDNEEAYLTFVETIPDFQKKPERAKQARNAWACHVKRDAQKQESASQVA